MKIKDVSVEQIKQTCEIYYANKCQKCPIQQMCKYFIIRPKHLPIENFYKEIDL